MMKNEMKLIKKSRMMLSPSRRRMKESIAAGYRLEVVGYRKKTIARIFHTSHSEAQTKVYESRRRKDCDQGCMSTYCSDHNSTTTHYSSALGQPQTERYEIFGIARLCREKLIFFLPASCTLQLVT